jgi:PKD repeat protein
VTAADLHIYEGDDYESIIENAPANSTIYWHAGTYSGVKVSVILPDYVHIIGDGADVVIIKNTYFTDEGGSGRGATLEGLYLGSWTQVQYVNVGGLTIKDSVMAGTSEQLLRSDSVIENCTIKDEIYINSGSSGGIIRNNIFEEASSDSPLHLNNGGSMLITNNTFRNIHTSNGVGICVNNIEFSNNHFKDVTSDSTEILGLSGMLNSPISGIVIKENTFENCTVLGEETSMGPVVIPNTCISLFAAEGTLYLNNFENVTANHYIAEMVMTMSMSNAICESPSAINYTYMNGSHSSILGNYYDTYEGEDGDGDGIGDTAFTHDVGTDNYPLMGAWNAAGNEISEPEIVAPVADFSADVTSGDAPLTVNFSDASTDAENWSWDLDGDGVEDSNETKPQFTYAEAGTYNVTLTVSNSAGSDTETKAGYITCIQPLPVLSFAPEDASVSENHYTDIDITVNSLPDGLSGYNFTVSIADPGVAEIVGISYPSWANLTENSSLPRSSVYLKTLDGNSQLEAGAEDVVLATITVYGKEMGSTNLTLDIHRLDDDTGSEIEAELAVGTLEVTMTAIPGQTNSPQDLDGDGFYEDMTGDGSFSFVDVEVFFHQMDWIEDNLPVGDFDLNGNGRIDFDDIVDMFEKLG